ncbi:MAG: DUF421 domain-containing protein [Oscillospiraceae bacterium]|jgi:uncharacterized membrane protein YcaP (DUF421 family)
MFVVMFRAILLYILIILSMRLMGKRQLGELQPSELVTTILVSNIASIPIEDPSLPMALSAIPILTLVVFEVLMSTLTLKSKRFRKIMTGSPMVIIENGVIDQRKMKKLRLNIDDLMEELRTNNIFNIEDVHYAIVETTGKISVMLKYKAQTVTPEMLQLKGSDPLIPSVVISDGIVLEHALQSCSLGRSWLEQTVKENCIRISDVFLMTADANANYYIVPKQTMEKQNNG